MARKDYEFVAPFSSHEMPEPPHRQLRYNGFEVSMTIHEEQFVVDKEGNRIGVVLNIEDYQNLLADVEELESIRAFDEAKASGEKPIPFERAVAEIEARQK